MPNMQKAGPSIMGGEDVDTRKLLLTWDDFEEAILAGSHSLKAQPFMLACKAIYGIPRGGLVVAVALSHQLQLPLVLTPGPGCLIVDDVLETGATMLELLSELGTDAAKVAAWVWISKNAQMNEGYHRFVEPHTWVVFPWEDWQSAEEDKASYERRTARKISS
jgi:xanthine phosphoribosyltransferase